MKHVMKQQLILKMENTHLNDSSGISNILKIKFQGCTHVELFQKRAQMNFFNQKILAISVDYVTSKIITIKTDLTAASICYENR